MDRLNSLMRGSMMGGSSAPPGAVSEPKSKAIIEHHAANIPPTFKTLTIAC